MARKGALRNETIHDLFFCGYASSVEDCGNISVCSWSCYVQLYALEAVQVGKVDLVVYAGACVGQASIATGPCRNLQAY